MKKKVSLYLLVLTCLLVAYPVSAKKLVFFGLDGTGSYSFQKQAMDLAKKVIQQLEPGDVFYMRRITENSFTDNGALFRLTIPESLDKPANEFNAKAKYRWIKSKQRVQQVKAKAIAYLKKIEPMKAKKTDIWGFFAAVADRFQVYDQTSQKFNRKIIIASDMQDNCYRKTDLNLMEAVVSIVGFESGKSPKKARKLKKFWVDALTDCQAKSVKFYPLDCPIIFPK